MSKRSRPGPGPLSRTRNGASSSSSFRTPHPVNPAGRKRPSEPHPPLPASTVPQMKGILTAVRLKNFMNHAKLDLKLDPGVNVITGANGAGKSSLLQALVLALGAQAKDTHRATKVNDFVKRGESKAEIEVDIFNGETEDDYGYKFSEYGRTITFVRWIHFKTGSSDHMLKNHEGKVINKKAAEEKQRVCTHHSIEVDNPTCILQQEMAKSFFESVDEAQMFKFFSSATQIQRVAKSYQDIKDKNRKMKAIKELKALAKEDSAALEEAKRALAALPQVSTTEELQEEYAWRIVRDLEQEVKAQEDGLTKSQALLDTRKKNIGENRKKKEEFETEEKVLSGSLNAATYELEDLKVKFVEAKSLGDTARQELADAREEDDEATTRLAIKRKVRLEEDNKLKTYKKKKKQSEEEIQGRKDALKQKKDAETEEYKKIKARTDVIEQKLKAEEQKKKELVNEGRALASKKQGMDRQVKGLNDEIHKVNRSESSRFGPGIDGLLRDLDANAGKFRNGKKPIGPLANYIGPKSDDNNSKLIELIETILGQDVLNGFLVESSEDQRTLANMMKNHFRGRKQPCIFVHTLQGGRLDISQGRVVQSRDYKVLVDLLRIDNDRVFNYLVDSNCSPELNLIMDEFKAQEIMSNPARVPKGVLRAYTMSNGAFYRYMPARNGQNYASYFVQNRRCNVLVADKQYIVGQLQREIAELKTEINTINTETYAINTKKAETERSIKMDQTSVDKGRSRMENISKKIEDLNKQEYELEKSSEDNLATLTGRLEEATAAVKTGEEVLKKVKESVKAAKDQLKKVEEEQRRAEAAFRTAETKKNESGESQKRDKIRNEVGRLEKMLQSDEAELEKEKTEQTKLVGKYKMTLSEHQEKLDNAKEFHPAGEAIEPREKQVLESVLSLTQHSSDTRKNLETKIEKSTKSIQECNESLAALEAAFKTLGKSLYARKHRLDFLRSVAIRFVSRYFTLGLGRYNMEGHMEVDVEKGRMTLTAGPRGNVADSIRTLSGGEKTRTLMCFIMALWSYQLPPFRCLDEWDVYLDGAAREDIENMLCQYGKSCIGYQFIFLSPTKCTVDGVKVHTLG